MVEVLADDQVQDGVTQKLQALVGEGCLVAALVVGAVQEGLHEEVRVPEANAQRPGERVDIQDDAFRRCTVRPLQLGRIRRSGEERGDQPLQPGHAVSLACEFLKEEGCVVPSEPEGIAQGIAGDPLCRGVGCIV